MLNKLLGTKVGMTQIFDENKRVVPVTVVDVGGWLVTQVKEKERNGYLALQLGLPRKRYRNVSFSAKWLQNKDKFFAHVKEVLFDEGADLSAYSLGQKIELKNLPFEQGGFVSVSGKSRGLGFQGVVKRWGFSGGPGGHGSTFHRAPGSIGNMCSQGNVIKGKKLPGHAGCQRITTKNLKVARVDQEHNYLFVKGAVPGKKNSLLFIRKQG